jgi:hypothetical protein
MIGRQSSNSEIARAVFHRNDQSALTGNGRFTFDIEQTPGHVRVL